MPEVAGGVAGALGRPRRAVAGRRSAATRAARGYEASRRRPGRAALRRRRRPTSCTTRSTRRCCSRSTDPVDVSRGVAVDYDDRDLRPSAPSPCVYRLPDAPVKDKTFWTRVERDLVDHLVRSRTVELQANRELKLFGRPGESADDFAARCLAAANDLADKETAALRDKYEDKVTRLQTQIQAAEDRAEVLDTQRKGRQSEEMLSTAGSILGGLLGGRRSRGGMLGSILGKAGSAAGRRSRTARRATASTLPRTSSRACIASSRTSRAELTARGHRHRRQVDGALRRTSPTMPVSLERTDVKVTQLALVWIPVPSRAR